MKTYTLWIIWLIAFLAGLTYFIMRLVFGETKEEFLIGDTTYGHYQIEMACETCHTSPFGGTEVLQNSCTQCHEQELETAHDSHPKSKFTDPRNANLLKIIDARYCISCHTEHQQEQTHAMGLTLPKDYCYHCHEDIGEERDSHKDLAFDSCASAGCHNYHDNRALYEKFLLENAGQPSLLESWHTSQTKALASTTAALAKEAPLTKAASDAPPTFTRENIVNEWHDDAHALAGVNCSGCHQSKAEAWIEKPNHEQCAECHQQETSGFLMGKHGMRLNPDLTQALAPATPSMSALNFQKEASHLTQGCNSCHGAHTFDTQTAAVDSCLGCHADQHSLAFNESPHGKLWQNKKMQPDIAAVSCATCHMPQIETTINGEQFLLVQHNQNDNLRPNEKMIRSVCLDCHGLEFAIDALADEKLIENNFSGKPTKHIPSVDWAKARDKK